MLSCADKRTCLFPLEILLDSAGLEGTGRGALLPHLLGLSYGRGIEGRKRGSGLGRVFQAMRI